MFSQESGKLCTTCLLERTAGIFLRQRVTLHGDLGPNLRTTSPKQMCVFETEFKFRIFEFPLPQGPRVEPSLPINLHFNEVFFQGTSSEWIL